MKKLNFDIIYSDLFFKFPLIRKCYNYYLKSSHEYEDIPQLFFEHTTYTQFGVKRAYPVGLYADKLIFIFKPEESDIYTIEEADLKYSIKYFNKVFPEILLSAEKLVGVYPRVLSIQRIEEFFKNES